MKTSNKIAISAAAFVILATIGGIAFSTQAASSDISQQQGFKLFGGRFFDEGEKEEFKIKKEDQKAEMEARRTATEKALEEGNYNAWKEAVGENCPMIEKINEGNFSRFVEAYQKMQEARTIMEELGIERGGFGNFGNQRGGFMKK